MSLSIMVSTRDQTIGWVSDSFAECVGVPTSQLTGRRIGDLLQGASNSTWMALFTGVGLRDEIFDNVGVHLADHLGTVDEFELRGVRYVDGGRNAMLSLRSNAPSENVEAHIRPGTHEECQHVRAVSRRNARHNRQRAIDGIQATHVEPAAPGSVAVATELRFGGLLIDVDNQRLTVDALPRETTTKEFELLAFLATRAGQVFSRCELLHHVWGSKPEWQTLDTVTEHVYRLRAKIEADPSRPTLLRNVHGKGYYFRAPVPL